MAKIKKGTRELRALSGDQGSSEKYAYKTPGNKGIFSRELGNKQKFKREQGNMYDPDKLFSNLLIITIISP